MVNCRYAGIPVDIPYVLILIYFYITGLDRSTKHTL